MMRIPYLPGEPFVMNCASEQAVGLVSWWPTLGSLGALHLRDYAGINGGVGTGISSWQPDQKLVFSPVYDGTSSRFDCGASEPFRNLSAATFVAWVRWGGAVNGMTGSARDIIRLDGAFAFGGGWTSGKVRLWTWDTSGALVAGPDSTSRIDDKNVHLVCAVIDGLTNSIYVDGKLEASSAYTGGIDASTNHLFISSNGGNSEWWNGLIGDCRIYRRALSQSEIRNIYAPETRWDLYEPIQTKRYFLPMDRKIKFTYVNLDGMGQRGFLV